MRVLTADKFEKVGIDGLKELGCTMSLQPDLSAETLPAAMQAFDPHILIVRGTRVKSDTLRAGAGLSLVIRAGAGVDTIDVEAASALGVFVANCPGKNSIAVAELAIGLILACDRRIPEQVAELRQGKWNKGEYSKARGLYGRTLGIVGLGQIGREVMLRAKAFGMPIVAWSRTLTVAEAAQLGVSYAETPLEVARLSDIVSIHVAANGETKHLVDTEFLAAMKPGAFLINTSRGSVIDEAALLEAVRTKGLRAGLDVFDGEPAGSNGTFQSAVTASSAVSGTHHVGASTDQAQVAIAHEVIRIVHEFMGGGAVPNCVNRLARSSATHVLAVRHLNRPGVLAHVFRLLAEASINVEEVENIIYHGAQATCARIHLDGAPSEAAMAAIKAGNADVIAVDLTQLE